MKHSNGGLEDIHVMSYQDGKYLIKFPNLEIPVSIDEHLYDKWLSQPQSSGV